MRTHWKPTLVAALAIALAACLSAAPARAQDQQQQKQQQQKPAPAGRPNILFVFADDWGRIAGAYAGLDGRPTESDVVRTPNIDRVAKEGVLFRNAHVTAPSCTPCRSSLLSGQYFFRTGRGAILLGATWDPAIPSYPLLLKDAGYHVGETWKVWSPGTPADAPFGAGEHAYEKAGGSYNAFSQNATRMVKQGMPFEQAKQKLLEQVRGNFRAFLADRKEGQPWHYWFGPTQVHRKFEKGSGQALWGIDPDSLKGKMPKFMPDVPEVRADMADYLGEIQSLDAGVGVLLEMLEEAGELENTIVVISGDHGPPGFPGGKCNLNDYGTAVPLIARVPGGKGGRVVDDLVNLMDLAPTFLEAAGVRPPEVMTGRSLLGVLKSEASGQVDPARTWVITGRERHVADAREQNLPYPQRALRTKEYLYIRNYEPDRWPMGAPYAVTATDAPPQQVLENETFVAFGDMDAGPTKAWLIAHRNDPQWKWHYDYAFGKRPAEELYDVKADPDQVKNLAADPAYAKIRSELSAELERKLKEANDPRVTSDGKVPFEHPPYTGGREPAKPRPKRK